MPKRRYERREPTHEWQQIRPHVTRLRSIKDDQVRRDLTTEEKNIMTPGSVGFFEIYVDDFQRAQQFYRDVFGWQFSLSGGVPYEFYMIDNSQKGDMGLQEGGMRKREKPLPPDTAVCGSVCYIVVEAIDEALEKIVQHGGTVTTPKAHIPAGYFAYALDTEGNPFGVWELEK